MTDFPRPPSSDEWHAIKYQVEESKKARDKYVPIIETTTAQVVEMHALMIRMERTVDKLAESVIPIVTERAMAIKALNYVGGVVSGVIVSGLVYLLIEWLKSR